MDWIYSWFVTPETTAPVVTTVEDLSTPVTVPIEPKVNSDDTDSVPDLIPINAEDPDPDEFSADVDSKYQTKSRATQEYQKRRSKRVRNKARRDQNKLYHHFFKNS